MLHNLGRGRGTQFALPHHLHIRNIVCGALEVAFQQGTRLIGLAVLTELVGDDLMRDERVRVRIECHHVAKGDGLLLALLEQAHGCRA